MNKPFTNTYSLLDFDFSFILASIVANNSDDGFDTSKEAVE